MAARRSSSNSRPSLSAGSKQQAQTEPRDGARELGRLEPSIIWLMIRLAIVLCVTATACLSQPPSSDPLLAWLDHIAQQQLDGRGRAIAAVRTRADADQRRAIVRAKLTGLIGGLPTYHGPLNARVTGRLQ